MVARVAFALLCTAVLAVPPAAAQMRPEPYRTACDAGDSGACGILALMHETGVGVGLDRFQALALYERACDAGDPGGCTGVGLLLASGAGGLAAVERIPELYQRACRGGEALACDLSEALTTSVAPGARRVYAKGGTIVEVQTGRPISQVVVRVPRLGLRVVSDDRGRVELGRLEAGSYDIIVEAFGYEPLTGSVDVPGNPFFLVGLNRARIEDPTAGGRVVGRVVDAETGEVMPDVEIVAVNREGRGTISNPQGRFELAVTPGLVDLNVSRLGYGIARNSVVVQPGETVDVSVRLSTQAVELDAIEVAVAGGAMARTGFYDRQATGVGTYFEVEDIELVQPKQLSHVFRGRTPGVRIMYGGPVPDDPRAMAMPGAKTIARAASFRRPPYCYLSVLVDGVQMPDDMSLDDIIAPDMIGAIEVYQGIGTPAPYDNVNPACGVILIWSKR